MEWSGVDDPWMRAVGSAGTAPPPPLSALLAPLHQLPAGKESDGPWMRNHTLLGTFKAAHTTSPCTPATLCFPLIFAHQNSSSPANRHYEGGLYWCARASPPHDELLADGEA
jgi:hypothetical protein